MPPTARRGVPPYVQIADHYRGLILAGKLPGDTRLPPIKDVAEQWGVSYMTAQRGFAQLKAEGFITSSSNGSFVAEDDSRPVTYSARDRITLVQRHGDIAGETVRVIGAGLVDCPPYVAELLGLTGGQVVRREWVTLNPHGRPLRLSVSWFAPELADALPALIEAEPIEGEAVLAIESATGRRVTHGHDHIRGRASDAREAGSLQVPVGTPILAGVHLWTDPAGVIEYGEWCLLPDFTISYEYDVGGSVVEDLGHDEAGDLYRD